MSTERFELIAPCHFGLEAVLKREILDLGYEISKVEDGKVTFLADAQGIADANVFLRTTERILLKIAEVKAETFDELFEATKALPWERYIPADGKFWIAKANSVKSKLFSPSDIQSIMKKAIVERLKGVYGVSWFEEDGASFPIRVAFMKDVATIGIDTSAVHMEGGRSHIDEDACIKCGKCLEACPYNAIIKQERPCSMACGMNAIGYDEYGRAEIVQAELLMKMIICLDLPVPRNMAAYMYRPIRRLSISLQEKCLQQAVK